MLSRRDRRDRRARLAWPRGASPGPAGGLAGVAL